MIRTGKNEDKKSIFDIYGRQNALEFENREDYFAKSFKASNVLVNEVNGHVVASLQVNNCPMMLHGKKIIASYLCGQFYDQNKGVKNMNNLLTQAIGFEQYKSLITIIPTTNANEYRKYGFEDIYSKREYSITRDDLAYASYQGVSKSFNILEISELYQKFTTNFDGYFIRDKQYWLDLLDLLKFKKYNLAIYRNEQNEAEGYMIYYIEPSKIVVSEIIYLNGSALTRLLCYALRLKKAIKVYTSANEDFTKAFPDIHYKMVTQMVVRVNDFELFSKLYGSEINTNKQAFCIGSLPLFFNEEIH